MDTIKDIQKEILEAKGGAIELDALKILTANEISLTGADSTSKVALWRLWVFVQSFSVWSLHKLFNIYKIEQEQRIEETRIHTKDWYREQALNYQHGHSLNKKTTYDNSNRTDEEVAEAKVIKHAAIVKIVIDGRGVLRCKVATEENGNLVEVSDAVKIGFTAYMNRIADAGTTVIPSTASHDDLKLQLDIYYDPTILNNQGKRLDGTNDTPVIDTINNYLTGIEFNGKFISTKQTDALQKVEGIVLPVIKKAWSKYGTYNYTDTSTQRVGLINEIRIADAGYMRLDEAETIINYIAYTDD